MSEKLIEGLREQHHRDSAELRRLCAERDHLRAERDSFQRVGIAAQARADRLAEALDAVVTFAVCYQLSEGDQCVVDARALLHTAAAQEGK